MKMSAGVRAKEILIIQFEINRIIEVGVINTF